MDFDAVVIGAGVVGLAVGRAISKMTENICIVEKNNSYGMETSSRNSEVIHSGIYYPPNSLKSRFSVDGNMLTYDYCQKKQIQFNKCGKLIIAMHKDELPILNELQANANLIGIKYSFLMKEQIKEMEPLINAEYALHVEPTGVIDSHAFMNSLHNELYESDVDIVYKTEVVAISQISNGYVLKISNPDDSYSEISTKILINCAGLYASTISSLVGIKEEIYQTQFWKGSYFWLKNKTANSLNYLIYPVPSKELDGLGIHTTKSVDGRVRVGPDAEYLGEDLNFDYSVDEEKKERFFNYVKTYLPFLKIDDLELDFSGVRPKLQKPGDQIKDFIIQNEKDNGFNNFINLIGIESPGLTSSLSIGEYVKNIISWRKIQS
jgi:L-2-hydroxyglutarate oxidase LhgO